MVITCRQMAEAEETLFSTGANAEPLMDKAGLGCALAIRNFFPHPGLATVFCGKGNNGGDALVAGRWLREWGWQVRVDLSHDPGEMSPLAARKLEELQSVRGARPPFISHPGPSILIDGLLGIGASGPLRGKIGESALRLNRIRNAERAVCFAVDIPSGVDGDTGEPYENAVVADYTLSICAPKTGLIGDSAINHVGRIVEIPLPEIPIESADRNVSLLFPSNLFPRLPQRNFDFHKGKAGRVAIVAGSPGFTGAPILSALGASRSGAGLVSLLVPAESYEVVASRAPAEIMVRGFRSVSEVQKIEADVFAIGPGLGPARASEFLSFFREDPRPMILDADALNAISEAREVLHDMPPLKRILTPHPGELRRLSDREGIRIALARTLAEEWKVTLLYKGSRTVVATPGLPVELNTTGHPGMASGGMGDVLTGMCAAFAGQGLSLHDSGCLGSWLLGRAAEIAAESTAKESICAVQVAEHIGNALFDLQSFPSETGDSTIG